MHKSLLNVPTDGGQKVECEWVTISPNSPCFQIFRQIVIIFALLSIFISAYLSCYGYHEYKTYIIVMESIFEIFFLIEIFVNFLVQYQDPEDDFKIIKDPKKIRWKYLKSTFILDAIATIPIIHTQGMIKFIHLDEHIRLFYILKLLRMHKLQDLASTKKFQDGVKSYFRRRL